MMHTHALFYVSINWHKQRKVMSHLFVHYREACVCVWHTKNGEYVCVLLNASPAGPLVMQKRIELPLE